MLVKDKKSFVKGLLMSAVFVAVLTVMFLPIFNGGNAFRAADKLFNTISKGSTYYIPMLLESAAPHKSKSFDGTLKLAAEHREDVQTVFSKAGADVRPDSGGLSVSVGLGTLYDAALRDSDDMFENRGDVVSQRYGIPEKRVLFAWWNGLKGLTKALDKEKRFAESAYVGELISRGVEVGYNYYTVKPEKASDKWLILTSALIFYVVYTLWWGFAIYFLFEGVGLQLTAGHKKES